jgi:hypothetical protein
VVRGTARVRAGIDDRWVAVRIGVRWKCRVVSGRGSGGECEYSRIEDIVNALRLDPMMPLAVRSPLRDEVQHGLKGLTAVLDEAGFPSLEPRFISL